MNVNNIRNYIDDTKYKGLYLVTYGNEYWGDAFTKEELIKNYKLVLKRAYNQDVTIFLNGKKIRSIINFNQKITNKNVRYYCEIKKY